MLSLALPCENCRAFADVAIARLFAPLVEADVAGEEAAAEPGAGFRRGLGLGLRRRLPRPLRGVGIARHRRLRGRTRLAGGAEGRRIAGACSVVADGAIDRIAG
jgi:hypothetical protein